MHFSSLTFLKESISVDSYMTRVFLLRGCLAWEAPSLDNAVAIKGGKAWSRKGDDVKETKLKLNWIFIQKVNTLIDVLPMT